MSNHHDELFQHLMSNDDDLRAHLQAVLDPEITADIDWDAMTRLPTVLHDPGERELRSDLMVMLPSAHGLFVVILVYEHQSQPSRDIAVRITRYLLRGLQDYAAHDDALPVIPIAIVLTHDLSSWSEPPSLIPESLSNHPFVERYRHAILDLQPIVIDLANPPPAVLCSPPTIAFGLRLLAASTTRRMWEVAAEHTDQFMEAIRARGERTWRAFVGYAYKIDSRPPPESLVNTMKTLENDIDPDAPSYAEQLRQMGHQDGMKAGREAGRSEAENTLRNTIRMALQQRVTLTEEQEDALARADFQTLNEWVLHLADPDLSFLR